MASIDVGIHPDAAGITTKHFPGGPPASFSTLNIAAGSSRMSIFVNSRPVLEALQAALREIETDFGEAEQAAMAAKRTARADEIKAAWQAEVATAEAPCHCDASTARDGHIHEADGSVLCIHHEGEDGSDCPQKKIRDALDAQTASDQVPTVMADWPAGPPGELAQVFGK